MIIKEAKKKAECPHCSQPQYKIKYEKPTSFFEETPEGSVRITPSEIQKRFEGIPTLDLRLLGIDAHHSRPEWMIISVLPVPPVSVRASITLESGVRSEDDLTHKLVDIIRINQRLRENIEAANKKKVSVNALMTGTSELDFGEVAYHPPLESELHGLSNMLVVVADRKQVLIASADLDTTGTITNNHNMVIITHQFVWMELFTQRVNKHMGPELLERLNPEDREIFESWNHKINTN